MLLVPVRLEHRDARGMFQPGDNEEKRSRTPKAVERIDKHTLRRRKLGEFGKRAACLRDKAGLDQP